MVYGFDGYTPIYEDTDFPVLIEETNPTFIDVKRDMVNTTSTIASSLNQKVNTDFIQHFFKHPDIEIVNTKFLNQVTIPIKIVYESGETKTVNTKIFTYTDTNNLSAVGTIHMTGARTCDEARLAIAKLIGIMKQVSFRVRVDGEDTDKIIYAVDDIDALNIDTMHFKYFMHNSVFKLPSYCYGSFYEILKSEGYDVSFNPNVYAGVVLKMVIDGVNVTYILFSSGKTTTSIACPGEVCVEQLKVKIFDSLQILYRKHFNDIQIRNYSIPKKKQTVPLL